MAVQVTRKTIIEGIGMCKRMHCFAYLNTTTGEVVAVTTEELRAAEEDEPLEDFPQHGSMTPCVWRGRYWETEHSLPLPDQIRHPRIQHYGAFLPLGR